MSRLVIGGAGFIGSYFVDVLVKETEDKILAFDDLSSGKQEYVNPGAEFIYGNIEIPKFLRHVIKKYKVTHVYNFATKPLLHSLSSPEEGFRTNVEGTINCCKLAKDLGFKYVHISSSEVYGTCKKSPMSENHELNPTTPYGASKAAADLYIKAYYLFAGIRSSIIRPFNAYGPRMRTDSYCNVIYAFAKRLLNGLPPIIEGDTFGLQTRDMTYVTDTAEGIWLASEDDGLLGHMINVGSGKETKIVEIAKQCNKFFGEKVDRLVFAPARFPNDVSKHIADISRMKERFDWQPKIKFEDGIKKTLTWIQEEYKHVQIPP